MATDTTNPLLELHQHADAEFQPYGPVQIVSTFGEPQAEYAAIRKGCAMMDLPQRGILELTGKDRLDFLNRLITNETYNKQNKSGLPSGAGVYAFFLNAKGRIVTDMTVLERGDRTWLEMDGRMVESLKAALDKFLFADQVKLTSRVGELHEIALYGPKSLQMLNQILAVSSSPSPGTPGEGRGEGVLHSEIKSPHPNPLPAYQERGQERMMNSNTTTPVPLPELAILGSMAINLLDIQTVVWRDDPAGVPGYHLIFPAAAAQMIWTTLLSRFGVADESGKKALRPIGWAAFNATRIEAGRPIFGIDFDDSVLPAETGRLAQAVSLTKGCYLGQEIVARMHSRGQIARQIVGLRMDDDALPIAGTQVLDELDNVIGGITSSTMSPILSDVPICLGYVKKQFMAPGTRVIIPAEGSKRSGKVVDLPFYKG